MPNMTTTQPTHPAFIYHNTFKNTFSLINTPPSTTSMSSRDAADDAVAKDPSLQSFTATGRPIPHPKDSRNGRALNSMGVAESWGAGAPNLLPVKFTDDSIISIPVMPSAENADQAIKTKTVDSDSDDDGNPIKDASPRRKSRLGSFFRRKSSSSASKKPKEPEFVMKDVTRAEYLKHYAKDDDGNYTGTHDPAPDCILRNERDRYKYKRKHAFREAMAVGQSQMFVGMG